jgi:hypothetical protein
LDIEAHTCIIFNSGIIAYPANRALCASALSKSKKGRLIVLGSEKFFEDEYIEKEENKKITVIINNGLFFYCLFIIYLLYFYLIK